MEKHNELQEQALIKISTYNALLKKEIKLDELIKTNNEQISLKEKELKESFQETSLQVERVYSDFFLFLMRNYKSFEQELTKEQEEDDNYVSLDFDGLLKAYNDGKLYTEGKSLQLMGQGKGKEPVLKVIINAKK